MDLSVIIVSWNVREKLVRNLAALFASDFSGTFEVFVVDNDSDDGSADVVRRDFPQVKLLANQENLGFSRANNLAIRQAAGRFILLLNPDMQVEADTLKRALSWAEANPQAVVSGCRLVNERGETIRQVRRFPRLLDQLLVVSKLPHLFPFLLNNYLAVKFNYDQPARVDSLRGAFFLINRERFAAVSGRPRPLLDERYFVWFEEIDFCRQIYGWGGEVWYSPAARCLDYVGASFKQLPRSKSQQYFRDSMVQYFEKWHRPWEAAVLRLAWRLVRLFV